MSAPTKSLTLEQTCRTADATIGHARTCKKSPADCLHCTRTIAFYASLPLATLAVVLADRPALKSSH